MMEFRKILLRTMGKKTLRFKDEEEFEEAAMLYFACRCASLESKQLTMAVEFGSRPFVLGATIDNRSAYNEVARVSALWDMHCSSSEESLFFIARPQDEVIA
jgi:hypothetical protein